MLKIESIKYSQNYKFAKALQTLKTAKICPDSVPPEEFYISYAKFNKRMDKNFYKQMVETFKPIIDKFRVQYGKDGCTTVARKALDSDEFIDTFINTVSNHTVQLKTHAPASKKVRMIIPSNKYKS